VFPTSFRGQTNDKGEIEYSAPRDLFTQTFYCPWEQKKPSALFRGTATGGGVTPETNQRLRIAQLGYEWEQMSVQTPGQLLPKKVLDPTTGQTVPLLDAKITGWNYRDKKIATTPMTFIQPKEYPFTGSKANFIEIYKQSTYKYLIYIEGHCAACRYGFMMSLGSVILKVESTCVAGSMWYFPLVKEYYDHVPVKADMSDLEEKLKWCQENDDKCREIAANAKVS
jgi:hypothetical protein